MVQALQGQPEAPLHVVVACTGGAAIVEGRARVRQASIVIKGVGQVRLAGRVACCIAVVVATGHQTRQKSIYPCWSYVLITLLILKRTSGTTLLSLLRT